jgi:hypothetical protein
MTSEVRQPTRPLVGGSSAAPCCCRKVAFNEGRLAQDGYDDGLATIARIDFYISWLRPGDRGLGSFC